MAGLASLTPNSFIQRHRSAAACAAPLAFAAFARDVKTKACEANMHGDAGASGSAESGFSRKNAAAGTQSPRARNASSHDVTLLSHRLEVGEMPPRVLFRLENREALRVKPTCSERIANFLPPSMSGISFLRTCCGARATIDTDAGQRLKNDSDECRTKENS
jgi:hypothetical protein